MVDDVVHGDSGGVTVGLCTMLCRGSVDSSSNFQMKQSRPLTLEVIGVADDDHLQQVGVGDVGGPQRHHQVPEADERAVPVGEDRHDHVVLVVRKQTGVTTLPDAFLFWSYK